MKRTVPMKDADEFDALTKWRHVYHWRPGERKKLKRRFNRRERRDGRRAIEDGAS